jgi:multidrug/hemolysin transport system permease protein
MKLIGALIKRNLKLFFKDKGMFLTALITPMILLVLYVSFLGNIYRDNFLSMIPEGMQISDRIIDGLVGGQLVSSLLAVSTVTVAFCSNFLSVSDKASGTIRDFTVSPVKKETLSFAYYLSAIFASLIICLSATLISFVYLLSVGWYLSFVDVVLLIFDVILLTLFGTALSSVINYFLTTQGQISAVGTVVSSCYGFICGAYMPISSFSEGLRNVISLLPGTYGTSLLRNHAMNGAISKLREEGIPGETVEVLRDSFDCNVYFFEQRVDTPIMYLVVALTVVLLVLLYVFMNRLKNKKR